MFPCLSFKMHTMGVPSLDFGRAARPRARWASHLPPCTPLPAATLAGEPYAFVSQQRPLIPAWQSERPSTSHRVSRSPRLGA